MSRLCVCCTCFLLFFGYRIGSDSIAFSRQAKSLQSSLQALAERIEAVKSDHDRLENENKFLQDYIGGLTRNMTKNEIVRSGTKGRKSQK